MYSWNVEEYMRNLISENPPSDDFLTSFLGTNFGENDGEDDNMNGNGGDSAPLSASSGPSDSGKRHMDIKDSQVSFCAE